MWFKKNNVICEDCRHVVEKSSAQEITEIFEEIYTYKIYFCKDHRKNYDIRKKYSSLYSPFLIEPRFEKSFRVSEDGTPIGYVKKEEPVIEPDQNIANFVKEIKKYTWKPGRCPKCDKKISKRGMKIHDLRKHQGRTWKSR